MTSSRECAEKVGAPVSRFGTRFMMDAGFYGAASEAGFSGLDFYVGGRGGVLGDVDGDVVAAAFGFIAPDVVRTMWAAARELASADTMATMFADATVEWARRNLPEGLDYPELTRLCRTVAGAAPVAGLPLFAGWRAVQWPDDGPGGAAGALHVLREMRGGAHLVAVVAAGLPPVAAVLHAGGEGYAEMLGHSPPFPDIDDLDTAMDAVEATTTSIVAPAFDVLDPIDRDRLIELVDAVTAG